MILLSIICVNEKSIGRNNISSIGCCPFMKKKTDLNVNSSNYPQLIKTWQNLQFKYIFSSRYFNLF